MSLRVVFDTNVLFSAVGWSGKPRECLQLARSGVVQGLICQPIVDEIREKLVLKMGFSAEQALELIEELRAFLEHVDVSGELQGICADPDDDAILECALQGRATHIVTGDAKHLLPMRQFRGVKIVSPAEFLQVVYASGQAE